MGKLISAAQEAFENLASSLESVDKLRSIIGGLEIDGKRTFLDDYQAFLKAKEILDKLEAFRTTDLALHYLECAEALKSASGVVFKSEDESLLEGIQIELPKPVEPVEAKEEPKPVDIFKGYGGIHDVPETVEEEVEEPSDESTEKEPAEETPTDEEPDENTDNDDNFIAPKETFCEKLDKLVARVKNTGTEMVDSTVPEGFKAITWLDKIPRDKYMISRGRAVVDRYKGETIRPRCRNGREVYELTGANRKKSKRTSKVVVTPNELFETAFPEYSGVHVSRSGRVSIDDVTRPAIIGEATPDPKPVSAEQTITDCLSKPAESSESGWVDITWLEGIPGDKYSINAQGVVRNNRTMETVPSNKVLTDVGHMRQSVLWPDDKSTREVSRRTAVLVYQAFNPDMRGKRIVPQFRDGNTMNCSLDNLYLR